MDLENIYENDDIKDTTGPQTQNHSQDEGKDGKCRGSRCLVLMTVSLGLICVLLLVFITLYITITAERDLLKSYKNTVEEFNHIIISLQDKNTDLTQKKLELETELRKLYKLGNGSFFFISNELKSWSESREYCRDRGADLIIINTEEKQKHISSLVKESVWIGLSDIVNEGKMKWVDNSPLKQGFWEINEPNDTGGNEDCILLNPAEPVLNNWNDMPCSAMIKCICEK